MKNKFWALPVISALLLCGCNNTPTDNIPTNSENVSVYETSAYESETSTDLNISSQTESAPANTSNQLTEKEYGKITSEYWQEYTDFSNEINVIVNSAEGDFGKIKEMNAEILEAHNNAQAALDKFSDINPPNEYLELHQKLIKGAENEKRWLERQKDAYSADTEEEGNEIYGEILEEINSMPVDDLFPSVYVKIRLKLQGLE